MPEESTIGISTPQGVVQVPYGSQQVNVGGQNYNLAYGATGEVYAIPEGSKAPEGTTPTPTPAAVQYVQQGVAGTYTPETARDIAETEKVGIGEGQEIPLKQWVAATPEERQLLTGRVTPSTPELKLKLENAGLVTLDTGEKVYKYDYSRMPAELQTELKTRGIERYNQYINELPTTLQATTQEYSQEYNESVNKLLSETGGNLEYYNSLPMADISDEDRLLFSKTPISYDTENPYPDGTKEWYLFNIQKTQQMDNPTLKMIVESGGSVPYYDSLPNAELSDAQIEEYSKIVPDYNVDNPYPEGTKEWYTFAIAKSNAMATIDPTLSYIKDNGGSVEYYDSLPHSSVVSYIEPTYDADNPYEQGTKEAYIFDIAKSNEIDRQQAYRILEPYLATGVWQQIKEPTKEVTAPRVAQIDISNYINPAFDLSKIPVHTLFTENEVTRALTTVYGIEALNNVRNDLVNFSNETLAKMYSSNDPNAVKNAWIRAGLLDKLSINYQTLNPDMQGRVLVNINDPTVIPDIETSWKRLTTDERILVASNFDERGLKQRLIENAQDQFGIAGTLAIAAIPVFSTWLYWETMPTWQKVISIIGDVAVGGAIGGAVIRGARAVGTAGRLERFASAAGQVYKELEAQLVAPLSMLAHPIATIKMTAKGALDVVENLTNIKKLTYAVLTTSDATVRIRIGKDLTAADALLVRDEIAKLAKSGKTPRVELYNELGEKIATIELAQSPLIKAIGGGVVHTTPMGEAYLAELRLKGISVVGSSGGKDKLFVSFEPHPRFAEMTAGGVSGKQPTIMIWNKDSKVAKSVEQGTKTWQGTYELESTVPEGTILWEKEPAQVLFTRVGVNKTKVMIWLDKPLSTAQLLKLKALGIIEGFKAPFKTPISFVKEGEAINGLNDAQVSVLSDEMRLAGNDDLAKEINQTFRTVDDSEGYLETMVKRDMDLGNDVSASGVREQIKLSDERVRFEEAEARDIAASKRDNVEEMNLQTARAREVYDEDIRNTINKDRIEAGLPPIERREVRPETREEIAYSIRSEDIERANRPEIEERITRPIIPERPFRGETPKRITRVETTERPTRTERQERPARPERLVRPEEPYRTVRVTEPERPARPETPERPTRPEEPSRPTRPEIPTRPTRPEIPTRPTEPPMIKRPPELKGTGKELTREQLEAAVGWKQGFMYKYIYPPFEQEDIINSLEPIQGIPIKENIHSAYESIIRTQKGHIPPTITRDMGIMDITIKTSGVGGKPKIFFSEDKYQSTKSTKSGFKKANKSIKQKANASMAMSWNTKRK